MSTTTTRRKGRYSVIAAVAAATALALSACSSGTNSAESGATGGQSGSVAEPSGSFDSGNEVYDEIVNLGPIADEATIADSVWATKVKESGVLKVGGTETSELFSKLDPTTGKVIGFDAGISQLLAKYIFGDATKTTLTQVSVDTREELLVNGSVDVVIATYSVTPERLERIDFAGPYYSSASAILIKKDNADITGLESLAGKTVVTQAGSTGIPTIEEFIPEAEILALPDHAQAVEALKQGRADAYVIDQTLLLNAVLQNPELTIVGEPFGDEDLYGIGIQTDTDGQAFIDGFLEKIFSDGTWLALWHATIGEMTGVTTEPVAPAIGSAGN